MGVLVCGLLHMSIVLLVDLVSGELPTHSNLSEMTLDAQATGCRWTHHHVSHHSHSCGRENIGI